MGIYHLHFTRDETDSENGGFLRGEYGTPASALGAEPASLTLTFIPLFLNLALLIALKVCNFFLPQAPCICYSFCLEPFGSFLAHTSQDVVFSPFQRLHLHLGTYLDHLIKNIFRSSITSIILENCPDSEISHSSCPFICLQ